jgi:hypothetical protein
VYLIKSIWILFAVLIWLVPVNVYATAQGDTISNSDMEFTSVESPVPATQTTGTVTNSSSAKAETTKVEKVNIDKPDQKNNEQTLDTPRRYTELFDKPAGLNPFRFNNNSQPFYVLLNPATEQTLVQPQGADFEVSQYRAFLESGLKNLYLKSSSFL